MASGQHQMQIQNQEFSTSFKGQHVIMYVSLFYKSMF